MFPLVVQDLTCPLAPVCN